MGEREAKMSLFRDVVGLQVESGMAAGRQMAKKAPWNRGLNIARLLNEKGWRGNVLPPRRQCAKGRSLGAMGRENEETGAGQWGWGTEAKRFLRRDP